MTYPPRPSVELLDPPAHRALIMGRSSAVASNHPLASQAGLDILRQGGNAFDAAVAVGLTVGVVELYKRIGGDSFYHLRVAGQSSGEVIDATDAAPAASDVEAARRDGVATVGPPSASTPGTVAGLAEMHARHGRLRGTRSSAPRRRVRPVRLRRDRPVPRLRSG